MTSFINDGSIKLTEEASNFMWSNLFAHDPCHDWNPSGNRKRMGKLNSAFERITSNINNTSGGGIINKLNRGKRSYIQFGGNKNIMTGGDDSDILGNYEDFDTYDSIYLTANLTNFSSIEEFFKKFDLAKDEIQSGMLTRTKAENFRSFISIIQGVVDYIDYNRLDVVGYTGNSSDYNDEEESNTKMDVDDPQQYGGRDILPSSTFSFLPKVSLEIPNINNKENINNTKVKENIKVEENTNAEMKAKIDTEIKQIFQYLKTKISDTEFNAKEINQDTKEVIALNFNEKEENLNQQISKFYNIFENALLFYNKQQDLPIYSLINSYFIEDVLMISMIEILMGKTEIKFDDDFFEGIIINRKEYNTKKNFGNNHSIIKKEIKDFNFSLQKGGNTPAQIINNNFDIETIPIPSEDEFPLHPEQAYNIIQNAIAIISENMRTNFNDQQVLINEIQNETMNFLNSKYNDEEFKKNIETDREKIQRNSRIKYTYIKNYVNKLRDLFVNVISFFRKQYNSHKKEIRYIPEASPGSVSTAGAKLANNFLKTLTKGILMKSNSKYQTFKITNVDMEKNGDLYKDERDLLKEIADQGKIPSKLDPMLFDAFSNKLNYVFDHSDEIEVEKYQEQINKALNITKNDNKTQIFIINNAFTTEYEEKGKIIDSLIKEKNYNTICPITSILDAQGTFGSCSSGSITNGLNKNQNITLESTDNTFEFNIDINYDNNNGKTSVNYYTIYDSFGIYECNITAKIGKGKTTMEEKNVLSANNTFKLLLKYIEETFQKTNGAYWDVFLQDDRLSKLIQIASKKMIGDFGQELTAVVKGGGYTNNSSSNKMKNILLTNGDQPSTVRAGFLLLNAQGIEETNSVLYLSSSKGFVYKLNNSNLKGGGSKNKNKKTLKKKQQKKKSNKKSKTKKIDYYINHIYNKNK